MTSSMPWVKMYTEMLDDAKLGRLDDAHRWRFVSLVLLAGECDAEGYLVMGNTPMSMDDIAWRFRVGARHLAAQMNTFVNLGLVENTENGWRVTKFSDRQGRKQSDKREQWKERKARQRKKEAGPDWERLENKPNTENVTRDAIVTIPNVTRESSPRVEKRRVEKKEHGADAPLAGDPVKELATIFEQAAGIKMPIATTDKGKTHVGSMWWNPLREMISTANGAAPDLLRLAVKKLRAHQMTISDPNSCLKTFKSLHGEAITKPAFSESRTPAL